jgi:hypothetical protein
MPSHRAQSRLRRFGEIVAALLFIAMFAAFLLQVFTRYVLNESGDLDPGIRADRLHLDRLLVCSLSVA